MADADDQLQSGYHGTIDVTFQGDIAVLTMDCGENRFNKHFIQIFNAALDTVLANKAVKALITTGKGKFYSNGMDQNWEGQVRKSNPTDSKNFGADLYTLVRRVTLFPMPTICAINGHVFAMGAILSLAHDYRLMNSERGWWCLNEVHIKRRFSPLIMEFLRAMLGDGSTFRHAALLGGRYPALTAKEMGIIQDACAPDDVMPMAVKWAISTIPKGGYDRDHLQAMKQDAHGHVFQNPANRDTETAKL